VAAVGARNLHLVATLETLGPPLGQEVELPGLTWALRFYDPVALPELGTVTEAAGPAYTEVRAALGITTTVYHVVAQPGAGLTPHRGGHVGSGLASGHSSAARDLETIRDRLPGRERLVDEFAGAARAGLPRAQALLARALAPRDPAVAALAEQPGPDPEEVRRALLASVGGRSAWRPDTGGEPGAYAPAGARPGTGDPEATPDSSHRGDDPEDAGGG
jgi:hypothetical protein